MARGSRSENPGPQMVVSHRVPKKKSTGQLEFSLCPINSLYHLVAAPRNNAYDRGRPQVAGYDPRSLHYWLTGNAACEFTNATTTQLVDLVRRTWVSISCIALNFSPNCKRES
jgi:sugar (pentulose or hexulose) kinase